MRCSISGMHRNRQNLYICFSTQSSQIEAFFELRQFTMVQLVVSTRFSNFVIVSVVQQRGVCDSRGVRSIFLAGCLQPQFAHTCYFCVAYEHRCDSQRQPAATYDCGLGRPGGHLIRIRMGGGRMEPVHSSPTSNMRIRHLN